MAESVKFNVPYIDRKTGFKINARERAEVVDAENKDGVVFITLRKGESKSEIRACDLMAIAFYE